MHWIESLVRRFNALVEKEDLPEGLKKPDWWVSNTPVLRDIPSWLSEQLKSNQGMPTIEYWKEVEKRCRYNKDMKRLVCWKFVSSEEHKLHVIDALIYGVFEIKTNWGDELESWFYDKIFAPDM